MNLAASLRDAYSSPMAGYLRFPDTHEYVDAESLTYCDDGPLVPDHDSVVECGWCLEGVTNFGVQMFAVPLSLLGSLTPTRIDVVLPDQTEWAPEMWAKLNAPQSAHMMDGCFNQLGIAKHVARILAHWSKSTPDFDKTYLDLPFASTIVIKEVIADVKNTQVEFPRNTKLPGLLLSHDDLARIWDIPATNMPAAIQLRDMRYIERGGPGIVAVEIVGLKMEGRYIFKSRGKSPRTLYHELKQLLRMKPHPNVIARPLFLVTIRPPGTNVDKVCGFILKYYSGPTFERALPKKTADGTLQLNDQLRWAKEISRGLIHVQNSPAHFVSDLKMDNVLMPTVDGLETAVLINFEQSRNVFSWSPPEIYLIEWLTLMADSTDIDPSLSAKHTTLMQEYTQARGVDFSSRNRSAVYDNPNLGWYLPWVTSTAAEQEAGMVFCLEKALWCIFEGVGSINVALGASKPGQTLQEFQTFIKSPKVIQDLIAKYTFGSKEWTYGALGLYRNGSKIYPRGRAGLEGEPTATTDETKEAIQSVWADEVDRGEAFVRARMRFDEGLATPDDMQILPYLERPKLQEVLDHLESLSF